MDDILQNIKRTHIETKLDEINNLHPSLRFTIERESNGAIPFLDMKIMNNEGQLSSTWYNKPTDTGLIMNFHALAPKRYKRSVVSGLVHRIHRACSTWEYFHSSLQRAKQILERNQYPPAFYEPIIQDTLSSIITPVEDKASIPENRPSPPPNDRLQGEVHPACPADIQKKLLFVQYRGKCTEDYARALHRLKAPCTIVSTLRKLKTVLPSLKTPVEKPLRSGVVYKITCPRCQSCYVGATTRHCKTRFNEHMKPSAGVKKHLRKCNA